MKNIKLKSLVISCLIILLFCSCSPTINVQVDSKENVSLEFSSVIQYNIMRFKRKNGDTGMFWLSVFLITM